MPWAHSAMARSKQTITMDQLKELGKATLAEPNPTYYLSEDLAVVAAGHLRFFQAVGPHTKRLNPASLAILGKDLFKMSGTESKQFGFALSAAYSHCLHVGSKAKTGEKVPKEVWAVYQASCKQGDSTLRTMKSETKFERDCSPPAKKTMRICLSSPSQITSMYSGASSSAAVKVMGGCAPDKHKHSGCISLASIICAPPYIHTHIYIYIYIHTYVYADRRHCKMSPRRIHACSICPLKVEPLEMNQDIEQAAALYSGSAVAIKVVGLCVHDKPKRTGCIHTCVLHLTTYK